MLVPNSDWRTLLSLSVRIGLVPGAAVVIYRILGPRTGSRNKYCLAIFIAVMMVTVFGFVPFHQGPPAAVAAVSFRPQNASRTGGNDGSPANQFRPNSEFGICPGAETGAFKLIQSAASGSVIRVFN
jgi:hypothetical protein